MHKANDTTSKPQDTSNQPGQMAGRDQQAEEAGQATGAGRNPGSGRNPASTPATARKGTAEDLGLSRDKK